MHSLLTIGNTEIAQFKEQLGFDQVKCLSIHSMPILHTMYIHIPIHTCKFVVCVCKKEKCQVHCPKTNVKVNLPTIDTNKKQQQEIEMPAKVYKFHAMLQINIPTPTPPLTSIALAPIEKIPITLMHYKHTYIHTFNESNSSSSSSRRVQEVRAY